MAFTQSHREGFAPQGSAEDARIQLSLNQARMLRSRRAQFFAPDLFSDPAWDILLLLAIEPQRTGLAAAEIAGSVGCPESVAARWLKILVSKGDVEVGIEDTAGDPLYRLTDQAFAALVNVFATVCEPETRAAVATESQPAQGPAPA
jgi:hypothetical protein